MKKVLLFIAMITLFAGLDAKHKGDGKNQLVNDTGYAISVKFDTDGDFVGLNSNDRIDIPNNCSCVNLSFIKDSTEINSGCYPICNDRSGSITIVDDKFSVSSALIQVSGSYQNKCLEGPNKKSCSDCLNQNNLFTCQKCHVPNNAVPWEHSNAHDVVSSINLWDQTKAKDGTVYLYNDLGVLKSDPTGTK